jgi:hypothetical protein
MSYELIDRFLRNNLGDNDYAEYSEALDSICPREWQGLTDEEINAGMDRAVLPVEMQQAFGAGARWAEAKLKEKNGG